MLNAEGEVLANRKVDNCVGDVVEVVSQTLILTESDQKTIVRAAIESCSGAAHLAEELMRCVPWMVTLAHPGIVARMKQNPEKSDQADAFTLGDLMRLNYLPKVWLAPEEIRQLRSLVRYRMQKVKHRTRVKLRLRAILREQRLQAPKGMRAWTRLWLHWFKSLELDETNAFLRDEYFEELDQLDQKIAEVERKLKMQTADDAVVQKLMSMEGIGLVTAVTMRAEIGRFERFDSGKHLARYCGVTPRNASSGQRQADAGLVKSGNSGLRVVLIQAAQRLMNHSERWSLFSAKLKLKGKPHNVVVAAVANRWMRWLYHQLQPEQLMLTT